jgi:hypothetical protein
LEATTTVIVDAMNTLQCTITPEEFVAQGNSGTAVMFVLAILFFIFDAAVIALVVLCSKSQGTGKLKAN